MPAETPPVDGDRRDRIARHVRDTVRLRLGPRAIEQAAEGPIMLSGTEADAIADAALAVRDDELERLRGELAEVHKLLPVSRHPSDDYRNALANAVTALVEQRERADAAEAVIERVRARHPRDDSNPRGPWCPTCLTAWPCPTIAALDTPETPGDAEESDQWRWDEREIDGGFSGNEFPRLWPPRSAPETTPDAPTEETDHGR